MILVKCKEICKFLTDTNRIHVFRDFSSTINTFLKSDLVSIFTLKLQEILMYLSILNKALFKRRKFFPRTAHIRQKHRNLILFFLLISNPEKNLQNTKRVKKNGFLLLFIQLITLYNCSLVSIPIAYTYAHATIGLYLPFIPAKISNENSCSRF